MNKRRLMIPWLGGVTFAIAMSVMPAAALWADSQESAAPPSIATVQSSYGKLPLSFEANRGQWDASVQFVTRGRGHTLFLTPREAVLFLQTSEAMHQGRTGDVSHLKPLNDPSPRSHSVVRMQFSGADPQAQVVGLEPLPGIANYFIGDDPSKWHTNIPTYQQVGYKDLYPGIDLVYYGNQGHLEYDLIVAPGADPTQIMVAFDGTDQISVDEQGDLVMTLPSTSRSEAGIAASTLRLHKPIVYQMDEQGEKHLLAGSYALKTSESASARPTVAVHSRETRQVVFQVASYDSSQPLIIDPILSWATYLGGNDGDSAGGIAVDNVGNVYVTGTTSSHNFPGTASSSLQKTYAGGGSDAFVSKLNAAGTAILYSTYLGGSGDDHGHGIAVDSEGQVYLTGATNSQGSSFPGTSGSLIQSTHSGNDFDAFVTKLNPAGTSILYSAYLGGSSEDAGYGVAIDLAGQAYVTGVSGGPGFPVTIPNTCMGNSDAFIAKFNVAGTSLVYSTCLGGSDTDEGRAIAIDQEGNAYVTGNAGFGFPGTASSLIQSTFGGGFYDAFVTKLNAKGTGILYSSYLGGSGVDIGLGIAVDLTGNAYVTGSTAGFPRTVGNSFQSAYGGGDSDAFVAKLNATATAILYLTYLGGSGDDGGHGIAVDQAGNAYVTGDTTTPGSGFPGTDSSPIQRTFGGGQGDAFMAKLNTAGTALIYSTYLGSGGWDTGRGIAVDQVGNAYVAGNTTSRGFPGTASSLIQHIYAGTQHPSNDIGDAFIGKITSASIVNDLVTLVPQASTYRTTTNSTGCPSGFVGTFSFDARLTNKPSSPPLSDLAVQVKTLSNGNLLHNADGGNGGVGSTLTVPKKNGYTDGILSHGESVDVHFSICLKDHKPFSFFVDVLGTR